jgi:hypothetical protein
MFSEYPKIPDCITINQVIRVKISVGLQGLVNKLRAPFVKIFLHHERDSLIRVA